MSPTKLLKRKTTVSWKFIDLQAARKTVCFIAIANKQKVAVREILSSLHSTFSISHCNYNVQM